MEVVGAIFTILGATNITATSVWRLCDNWREAPAAIHELRDFLSQTQDFWAAVKNSLEASRALEVRSLSEKKLLQGPSESSSSSPWQDEQTLQGLAQLLQRGHAILTKMQTIITQVTQGMVTQGTVTQGTLTGNEMEGPNETRSLNARRKIAWITKSHQMRKLKMALSQNNELIYGKLLALNVQISAEVASTHRTTQKHLVEHLETQLARSQEELRTGFDSSIQASMARLLVEMERRGSMSSSSTAAGSMLDKFEFNNSMSESSTLVPMSPSSFSSHIFDEPNEYMSLSPKTGSMIQERGRTKRSLDAVATVATETLVPHRAISSCTWACKCACHSSSSHTSWRLTALRQMVGHMTVSYDGFGFSQQSSEEQQRQKCTLPSCRDKPGWRWVRIHYSFPRWLTDLVISTAYYWRSSRSGPEAILRVSRRIPEDTISISQSIFSAIDRRDILGVKRFLAREPFSAIDERADSELCAIHAAIQHEQLEMAEILLRAGADPFKPDRFGTSAIAAAFAFVVESIDTQAPFRSLPNLQLAMARYISEEAGLSDLQKILLGLLPIRLGDVISTPAITSQINVLSADRKWTPLLLAAFRSDVSAVRLLLENGADPNLTSAFGSSPLHRAAWSCSLEITSLLLEAGADPNKKTGVGTTPLLMAVLHSPPQQPQILNLLLKYNADIHACNRWGVQALSRAVIRDNFRNVEWLANQAAVDINHGDYEGDTALIESVSYNAVMSARVLLERGVYFRKRNANGRGALHWLASVGSVQMMRLFRDKCTEKKLDGLGRDLDARDKLGKSPRDLFREREDGDQTLEEEWELLVKSLERDQDKGRESLDEFFDAVERL